MLRVLVCSHRTYDFIKCFADLEIDFKFDQLGKIPAKDVSGLKSIPDKAENTNISNEKFTHKPTWKSSQLQMLLETAKHYQQSDGNVNYMELLPALKSIPELADCSSLDVRLQLQSIKEMIQSPGIDKIRGQPFAEAALNLFVRVGMHGDNPQESSNAIQYQKEVSDNEIEMLSDSECSVSLNYLASDTGYDHEFT